MKKRYVILFMRRNVILAAIVATIVWIPLLITALCYDVLHYDFYMAFSPYAILLIYMLLCGISSCRFLQIISAQEKQHQVSFGGKENRLDEMQFICGDWLVFAGQYAFYKKYILCISTKACNQCSPSVHTSLTITTTENKKYTVSSVCSRAIKEIRCWLDD